MPDAHKSTPRWFKHPLWVILILFLLFAVPIYLAWLTSKNQTLSPDHTTQHGQFILPVVPLTSLNLLASDGEAVPVSTWKGRWLLMYLLPATCDANCEQGIYYLRQIRTATGKDSERVQRAVLSVSGQTISAHLQQLLDTDFVGTLQFIISQDDLAKLTERHRATPSTAAGNLYVVDPLGNVLMVYGPHTKPMDVYKDLQRLLKTSQIG